MDGHSFPVSSIQIPLCGDSFYGGGMISADSAAFGKKEKL